MSAFIPTLSDLQHVHYFAHELVGAVALLVLAWWITDRGIDHVVRFWNQRRASNVVPFRRVSPWKL